MDIKLKLATIESIPILIELEKSVSDLHTYSVMLTENEWKDEFKKNIIFIIEKKNLAVGHISYEKKSDKHAYISDLMVCTDFQGKGIGRCALKLLLEILNEYKKIDLVTHPDNVKSLKLYKTFGFVVESRVENYFGDGEPRVILVKNN